MTDVKTLLIDTISSQYDYPISLQGSLSDDETYPDSFFTFWNNDTTDDEFYDNHETQTVWDFDLNFYSNDPKKVNTVLKELKPILKGAGFIIDGAGHDVMSDEPSHTGRGINLVYIEKVR